MLAFLDSDILKRWRAKKGDWDRKQGDGRGGIHTIYKYLHEL